MFKGPEVMLRSQFHFYVDAMLIMGCTEAYIYAMRSKVNMYVIHVISYI